MTKVLSAVLFLFVTLCGYAESVQAQTPEACFLERNCIEIEVDSYAFSDQTFGGSDPSSEGLGIGIDFFISKEINKKNTTTYKDALYLFINSDILRTLQGMPSGDVYYGEVEVGFGRKDFDYGRQEDDDEEDPMLGTWEVAVKVERSAQAESLTIYIPVLIPKLWFIFSRLQFDDKEVSVRLLSKHIRSYNPYYEISDYEFRSTGFGVEVASRYNMPLGLKGFSRFEGSNVMGDASSPVYGEIGISGAYIELESRLQYELSERLSIVGGAEFKVLDHNLPEEYAPGIEFRDRRNYGLRFTLGGKIKTPF